MSTRKSANPFARKEIMANRKGHPGSPRINTPRKTGAMPFQLAIIYLRANGLTLLQALVLMCTVYTYIRRFSPSFLRT